MSRITKFFTAACLLGVLALGSAGSYAYTTTCPNSEGYPLNGCSLEGVVPGSYPYFDNTVNVLYNGKYFDKKGFFDIKVKSVKHSPATLVVDPDTEYSISKLKYGMKVRVDSEGSFGWLKLWGSLEDGTKFRVSANLNPGGKKDKSSRGEWSTSEDGTLWGFNTYDIVCKGLEGIVDCTQNEVVFLNLLSAIGPDTGVNKIRTAGTAITSVPVPAAAWLFGSGLLGLVAVSRRSRHAV